MGQIWQSLDKPASRFPPETCHTAVVFSQVPDFAAWFPLLEGFARPDWPAIGSWIKGNVPPEKLEDAWQGITREWLDRLRMQLSGGYTVVESAHFHLLSEQDAHGQRSLLRFLEETRARMLRQLGEIQLPQGDGKHVVLRFSALDDYYRYSSYFDTEGEHAGSSDMFIRRGYRHIAYPHNDGRDMASRFSSCSAGHSWLRRKVPRIPPRAH